MLSNLAIADILAKRREKVLTELAQSYHAGTLTADIAWQGVMIMIAQVEIERDIERREKALIQEARAVHAVGER